jgi:hypothetical protein
MQRSPDSVVRHKHNDSRVEVAAAPGPAVHGAAVAGDRLLDGAAKQAFAPHDGGRDSLRR